MWYLHGIGRASLSDTPDEQMITSMVARIVRDPFDREGWLFEHGFRAIAERTS
jgi:hypothetical protein